MTTKILWFTKHNPTNEQITALEDIYNDRIEIVHTSFKALSGIQIKDLMKQTGCTEVMAVLPGPKMSELVSTGVKPIRAVMKRTIANGTTVFVFDHFERITACNITTEPLTKKSTQKGEKNYVPRRNRVNI